MQTVATRSCCQQHVVRTPVRLDAVALQHSVLVPSLPRRTSRKRHCVAPRALATVAVGMGVGAAGAKLLSQIAAGLGVLGAAYIGRELLLEAEQVC